MSGVIVSFELFSNATVPIKIPTYTFCPKNVVTEKDIVEKEVEEKEVQKEVQATSIPKKILN